MRPEEIIGQILGHYRLIRPLGYGGSATVFLAEDINLQREEMQFVPTSITIKKGDKLTLVDDVAVVHVISNGRWDSNGTQRPAIEPGAPAVQVQFNGNDQQSIGPFNTTGTFHLYCTIHVNMNLTVVVQ